MPKHMAAPARAAGRFIRERVMPALSNIRARMVGTYLLMTLMPMVFILIFVFNVAAHAVKSEIAEYALNSIRQVNSGMDEAVGQALNRMARAGLDPALREALAATPQGDPAVRSAVTSALSGTLADMPDIDYAVLYGMDGSMYPMEGTGASPAPGLTLAGSAWFRTMLDGGLQQLVVPTHAMTEAAYEGNPLEVVSVIRRISDDKGGTVGFLLVDINIRAFESRLKTLAMHGTNTITVVDGAGNVVYDDDYAKIAHLLGESYAADVLRQGAGSIAVPGANGEQAVIFARSPGTGWTTIVTIPANVLYQRILNFESVLPYTLGLFGIIAVVIAMQLSRKMVEPILELRRQMARAENGDFDAAVEAARRDEMGELGRGFNSMMERTKGLIQRVYQTEILRREAELNALQTQINPHFLYNTLQIMDIMAEDKGAYEISASCQALAEIFRYSISRGRELVPLRDELEHIRNYVYILQLRLGDRLNVEYNIRPDHLDYEIVKLIVQPIVENAIVHGVEGSKKKCTIRLSTTVEKNDLYISVEDTGVGMSEQELSEVQKMLETSVPIKKEGSRGGIALNNVNSRIKLYFSDKYGLSIKSKKGVGTKVSIILPAKLAVK